jgi:D-3-phosphoglycerate dehydrogenase / 2-oxoglutarate reductase
VLSSDGAKNDSRGDETGMTTNKNKILVTESMSQQGRALLNERDDIELVEFPNMISAMDFKAMLTAHAPVHGVALGATRFGEPELEASRDMKVVTRIGVGFDAVDVPALSRRKVPLMVAGSANSPSVAEQAMFMMLVLAKRAAEMHSIVKEGNWTHRLGKLPYDLFGKTVLIVGFGRIGTRTAKRCLAMEMNVLVYDPYKPAAIPFPISMPRSPALTSSAFIARRRRRPLQCSMRRD